jgi:DNA-binding transcriptional regulator YhcF (GntR family)
MSPQDTSEFRKLIKDLTAARGRKNTPNRGALVILGAGCSLSANLPSGADVRKKIVRELASFEDVSLEKSDQVIFDLLKKMPKYSDLLKSGFNESYSDLFECLGTPKAQKRFMEILLASDKKQINWGHLVLGQMAKSGYFHTLITTNFDLLIQRAINMVGETPIVCDGTESLLKLSTNINDLYSPQVWHVHGSMHSYTIKNTDKQLEQIKSNASMQSHFANLLKASDLVLVLGYAGASNEGLMHMLKEGLKDYETPLYWVTYSNNFDDLTPMAKELLEDKRASNRTSLYGWDFDEFCLSLVRSLNDSMPEFLTKTHTFLMNEAERLVVSEKVPAVQELMENYKATVEVISRNSTQLDQAWSIAQVEGDQSVVSYLDKYPSFEKKIHKTDQKKYKIFLESLLNLGVKHGDKNTIERALSLWTLLSQEHSEIDVSTKIIGESICLHHALEYDNETRDEKLKLVVQICKELLSITGISKNDRFNLIDHQISAYRGLCNNAKDIGSLVNSYGDFLKLFDGQNFDLKSDIYEIKLAVSKCNFKRLFADQLFRYGSAVQSGGYKYNPIDILEEVNNEYVKIITAIDESTLSREYATTIYAGQANVLRNLGSRTKNIEHLTSASILMQRIITPNLKQESPVTWARRCALRANVFLDLALLISGSQRLSQLGIADQYYSELFAQWWSVENQEKGEDSALPRLKLETSVNWAQCLANMYELQKSKDIKEMSLELISQVQATNIDVGTKNKYKSEIEKFLPLLEH